MEGKSILKNNKGASLILVIGCVALLSVVGSMLLLVTMNNREMKELERKAQQTFYEADSSSDELAGQLAIEAEDALKLAFADMMVEYSQISNKADRESRFAEFFKEAFKQKVSASGAAGAIMRDALGLGLADALDVDVTFGTVSEETAPAANQTKVIRIQDATFTYTASNGSQAKITTDICVSAIIPDVEAGMGDSIKCDFTDFALITGADTASVINSGETVKIDGNLYTKNNLKLGDTATNATGLKMEILNAKKLLVGKELLLEKSANLKINNGSLSGGEGVWASGVTVADGGTLTANSNFYVADDLTVSGTNTKVFISGNEYIGYSGITGAADLSAANSAITINTAKNITIDLSGTTNLVLNGSSYIHDAIWSTLGDASNKLGILQGESVAYKDMQSMYLVPGECLKTGHNPMTKSEYEAATNGGVSCMVTDSFMYDLDHPDAYGNITASFSLAPYLADSKYVVRHVKLDGGVTEFVYLYLNFKDENAAQKYFADYMATDLAIPLKKQLNNMGASTIKLAQNNYTLANAFNFDSSSSTYGIQEATTSFTKLSTNSLLAKRRQKGLFTSFRMNTISSEPDSYDIINDGILNMTELGAVATNTWVKESYTVDGSTYNFWIYNCSDPATGVAELTSNPNLNGIMLVNGKLKINATGATVNGLVIATGGVEFVSQTNLTSNKTAVEALLKKDEVAKYFKGLGTGGGATPYLSSEAVTVSFENWQKN